MISSRSAGSLAFALSAAFPEDPQTDVVQDL